MQGTNVLFRQIAVVFGIVIAGVWSATQWTAAALGYQLRLGSPWFDLLGTPIYHPWKLFEWWFFFDAYAPRVFDTGGAIAGGSGLLAVVVAIGLSIWRSRQSRLVTTYGSARWANADDIRKAGLTQPAGVFLGQHDRQYLRHEGPEHVLTFAPTRSGKGVGLVVPTLLSCKRPAKRPLGPCEVVDFPRVHRRAVSESFSVGKRRIRLSLLWTWRCNSASSCTQLRKANSAGSFSRIGL